MSKKRRRKQPDSQIDADLIEFLSEFARFLVSAGVTHAKFAKIARSAFYSAAIAKARFSNLRVNQSAVAAMTGMTRLQVRELAADSEENLSAPRDRLDNLIHGWTTDVAFIDSKYRPRPLAVTGRQGAFAALVKKYGGDIPPRSALREMLRHECVAVRDGYAHLSGVARHSSGTARLSNMSKILREMVRDLSGDEERSSPIRSIQLEAVYPATSAKGRIVLQKRSTMSMKALIADLRSAGAAAAVESPPGSSHAGWLTRTKVLLITEDFEDQSNAARSASEEE